MKEAKGNLWEYPAQVRVITTNGSIKSNGEAVMGRGCAREAVRKYPSFPIFLGTELQKFGNVPLRFAWGTDPPVWTFPVKHKWWEVADLELIERSALHMQDFGTDFDSIVMPRPGCGNGRLLWEDVKKVIAPILDDRFTVITWR